MPNSSILSPATIPRDLAAGLVVTFVAVPLCLGVALASNAPLFAGLVGGVVGGVLVGALSRSHTVISGPAAGLTAVVAAQIAALGSFEAFLLAVILAGAIQIALGIAQAGFIAAFFPSSVVRGLLGAIGVLLILKQIPHLLGRDTDPEGEMSFFQADRENTFSELGELFYDVHPAAAAIGLTSIALLVLWERFKPLKASVIPAPLVVVLVGVAMSLAFQELGGRWMIEASHRVQVPVAESLAGFLGLLHRPDFSQWSNPAVYFAAVTIAMVASLETLLSVEAVDKIDPQQRTTPPSRELLAQGVGNVTLGLLGGIPVTPVIARSTVNINAGARTKLSTIFHGVFLFASVAMLPRWINAIPLSCLAAILLVTGFQLIPPALVKQMWRQGRYQFVPFAVTIVAIVFTDILVGVLVGLAVSISFILNSNLRAPIRRVVEKHLGGDVLRIELSNQVSFMKRAALAAALDVVPQGGHVLLDARNTDYIDPDVLDMIREYKNQTAPARNVDVSLLGFRNKYQLEDHIQYVDYSTRELQSMLSPAQVLEILKEGHRRFRSGDRLNRDLARQVDATASGQHPFAVVLSCIDSRAPVELIFDVGVGDIFSARVAGNIVSRKVLGSIEYACAVAGAKLVLVMGHTRCGAVTTAVKLAGSPDPPAVTTGCQNVEPILLDIQQSIRLDQRRGFDDWTKNKQDAFVNDVARENVRRMVERIVQESETLASLVREGKIAVVGAMYDVVNGDIEFLHEVAINV